MFVLFQEIQEMFIFHSPMLEVELSAGQSPTLMSHNEERMSIILCWDQTCHCLASSLSKPSCDSILRWCVSSQVIVSGETDRLPYHKT